ncbi:MAG TPA: sigma 54-interacting transcriptional regulator [Candidatus Acidoferrales bacterium]|nr:sigma 54-interacting transcriptional regulator [Candidatus Acidoferrales bacterium]
MNDPNTSHESGTPAEQLQALLEVSESIALHRDLAPLFHDLALRLCGLVQFDFLALILYDAEREVMQLRICESAKPSPAVPSIELKLDESPSGIVLQTQKSVAISSLIRESRFPRLREFLAQQGVESICAVPLSTAQRRLGTLGFGNRSPYEYSPAEISLMERIARQVAVAVDNALNYQRAQTYQQQLIRERDRLRALLDLTNAVVSQLDLQQLFRAIAASLRKLLECEYVSLAIYDPQTRRMHIRALDFPGGKGFLQPEMSLPAEQTPAGRAYATRQPVLIDEQEFARINPELGALVAAEGLRSGVALPLLTPQRALGALNLASLRENAFSQEDIEFLRLVAGQIGIAVENALAYREVEQSKEKLKEEKLYLEDEIRSEHNFEEMIGESAAWKRILEQLATVAATNSTVLILGETGTGKELIARAIHNNSARRERTFVRLNCAAIPTGLLESELFGHEKGAFTGAISRRIGRFELAHHGTLFLDEIGDIPLELQPKLLRVLQEQEFERLGSTSTIHVDVRLVAATNRDIAEMASGGKFRLDLYYRLNIFPIQVPPLRERKEDIPLLVRHFAQKHARELNRQIQTIPREALDAILQYSWPGNIRELENFIERAIILSPGSELRIPAAELRRRDLELSGEPRTLVEAEREHILRALAETRGILSGPNGAAVRLGMKRTTLQSKMRKLGIERHTQSSALRRH